jgi:uncharacterized membrane protein
MNTFTAGSCIRFGWETFKKRPWFLIGVTLVVGIIEQIINAPYRTASAAHASPIIQIATYLASFLLLCLVYMGLYHLTLKAHDDAERVSWNDLWHPQHYGSFVAASIMYFVIIAVGFALLIIPGIILLLVFAFPFYPIIERGLGPIEAFRYSKRITAGYRWQLLLLMILSVLAVILGMICLLVGVLVALPVIGLANVHAYRTLQKIAGETASAA